MNYIEFVRKFENSSVIDIRNVVTCFNGIDRRRLYEWQKKKYIQRVVNNFYVFTGRPIDERNLRIIACRIYQPSYIGLESALAYYNFIPEAVFQTICVTTRRNTIIKTKIGDFRYRSLKPDLFFGYRTIEMEGESFFVADPEKALLDVLYFLPNADEKAVLEEMRFNSQEILRRIDPDRMRKYLSLYGSPKMEKAVKCLMEVCRA